MKNTERKESDVANDVMKLVIKVIHQKSCSALTPKNVDKLMQPHMETIEIHRGFFKILMEWLRNACKASQSLNKHSMFNTKTENLVHEYVNKIKNPGPSN